MSNNADSSITRIQRLTERTFAQQQQRKLAQIMALIDGA